MTQLSTEPCRVRRLAVLCFFVFSFLFVAAASRPWVIAQAGWRVDLKEGETVASSLSIGNRCQSPHNFRVESKFKSLRFEEPTDSIRIAQGVTRTIPALFNAHGLKDKVYRGKVEVECLDCKEEKGCSQERDELDVEMKVVKSATVAEKSNAVTSNAQMTLNKEHEPIGGTWQIGVPITYVLTLTNPGPANPQVDIVDILPPGFVFVGATCVASNSASCPALNLPPPPFGPFNMPNNGKVVVKVTGYFKTPGSKTNTAFATPHGNPSIKLSNEMHDDVSVPGSSKLPDIRVTKSVTPTSTAFSSGSPPHQATMQYTIKVENTSSTDVHLAGLASLRDVLSTSSTIPLSLTTSPAPHPCTATGGAVCPDTSFGLVGGQIQFPYTSPNTGFLPGGSSYTIKFDVVVSHSATCGGPNVQVSNTAVLDFASGITAQIPGNNQSTVSTTISTALDLCTGGGTGGPGVSSIKTQIDPGSGAPTNDAIWNTPVKYRIEISNPTGAAVSLPLLDRIRKVAGTPAFTATVSSGPSCTNCTFTVAPVLSTPTVNNDGGLFTLWTATAQVQSLTGSQRAVIEYVVVYSPTCETDSRADRVINRIDGAGAAEVHTDLKEFTTCQLEVSKTDLTPGPIVFGQPHSYKIVYRNLSPTGMNIFVRDVLSVKSNRYGTFAVNSVATCSVTAGTVTVPAGHPAAVNANVSFRPFGWRGVRLIDENLEFGPSSTLECQVTVTAQQPKDTNPFCQGADDPKLVNSAYMDPNNFDENSNSAPPFYSSVETSLPLCRNLIVTKAATAQAFGPGQPFDYTVSVENIGDDPVSSFVLQDIVPLPITLQSSGVSSCTAISGCTTQPSVSGNQQIDVVYASLAPKTVVSFLIHAITPQAGGSYPNVAVGSFLPGGNFYFQGDEPNFLQAEEAIQVVTPTLSKRFDPVQIGPNGTSTLTFDITNVNGDPKQTGISFSDTLPAGLQITNVISNGCGGAVTPSTDGHTVTLTGGQLVGSNADGSGKHSCQISVQVKASGECGVFENKRANFSQVKNLDVSNVDAHLEVTGCSPKETPKLEKEFKPDKIGPNGTTTLAFTVTNSSGDPKQTGISFSDTLPAGLQIVSVVSNGCSGVVSVSSDGRTITLTGGQLVGSNADGSGKHSCTIMVKVKVVGECGVYRNSKENFSEVKNLDIAGIDEQLQVDCGTGPGLTVQKNVEGAPPGFNGQFNFLVQCATPNGFYQKAVTLNWPTPGFTVLNDVPAGSQCIVTEGPPPASLPANYAWAGLPSYLPQGGVVSIGPRGGKVTVTDTLSLCNETGQVTITKVVKGLPKDFIGVFEGTLQCWIGEKLQTFPITLTSPNGLSTTIGDIPLGSTCTFQETGQPPLTGDFKWDQPVYSPPFGTVTLKGECCQQITVTNQARHCCTPAKGSNYEPVPNNSYSQPPPKQDSSGRTAKGEPARRKQVPRQKQN